MATISADANGIILRFLKNATEENMQVPAPSGTAFTGHFDETTNAALVADLIANQASYTAPGGVLKKNGATVTIAAGSQDFNDRQQLQALLTALAAGTATQAQLGQGLRIVLRAVQRTGLI